MTTAGVKTTVGENSLTLPENLKAIFDLTSEGDLRGGPLRSGVASRLITAGFRFPFLLPRLRRWSDEASSRVMTLCVVANFLRFIHGLAWLIQQRHCNSPEF